MKVALALVLPAALAAALSIWAASLVGRTPPEPDLGPGTVLWAERFFTSQEGFAAWLNQRGASYRHWARRHPKAAARQRAAARALRSDSPNG
jgi:hypothetical protein